jgi:hypothetical protein
MRPCISLQFAKAILNDKTGELMQMKATRQRKTSSSKERVVSPSTPVDELVDDAQPVAAESGKGATLEANPTAVNESGPDPQLGLVVCPECGQRSLFWNRHDRVYRCVNPECKRQFTLGEYENREAGTLPDERQAEQIQASVSATEVIDKQEPATAEKIPSGESTTEATGEVQPPATEQMPSNVPIAEVRDKIDDDTTAPLPSEVSTTEVIDKQEPATAEKIPSSELTTELTDGVHPAAIEQMPSSVSTAEVKDEIERGKIEEISSDAPTTEARDEVKSEAKSAKKINRNLAFLLISVLAIGIVILGIFLSQKSGNLDELSSKLDKSRQALTQSQTQLAASQQDVEGLRTQLTQAQQEVEALQAEINELKPLTPRGPFVYSGELSGNDLRSFPIELKPSERVEGTITGGLGGLAVYIQDSKGGIAEDLGRVFHSSFTFTAQTSGTYALVIKEPSGLANKYVVNYTVYRRQ